MTFQERPRVDPASAGICLTRLTKSFGDTPVLRGVNLEVEGGTLLALLGPNGAGKTTTIRILATLLRPDGGTALVGGHDVVRQPDLVRGVIGLTGQQTSVDPLLTGRENLVMIGRLLRLGRRRSRQRAGELLEMFDLMEAADRPVKTYSGGMKRRLDLAVSLESAPRIMFLDEPTSGLDPSARHNVWKIIRELIDAGTTVLLTTQYLEEADHLANRIAVIDQGRIITEGTASSLKRQIGSERARLTFSLAEDFHAARSLLAEWAVPGHESAMTLLMSIRDPWQLHSTLGLLRDSNLEPESVTVAQPTLDDVFFSVTAAGSKEWS